MKKKKKKNSPVAKKPWCVRLSGKRSAHNSLESEVAASWGTEGSFIYTVVSNSRLVASGRLYIVRLYKQTAVAVVANDGTWEWESRCGTAFAAVAAASCGSL